MRVGAKDFFERKPAGQALMKEILRLVQLQEEDEAILGAIGGFPMVFHGERFGKAGYRFKTWLSRSGSDYDIELPVTVTPSGAIARLEYALSTFDAERDQHRTRVLEAERRLASYRPRLGEDFTLEAELELKCRELAEIEKHLAASQDENTVANEGRREA